VNRLNFSALFVEGGYKMKKIFMVSGLIMISGVIAFPGVAKEIRGPMKPIAPLMFDHRLIERMVGVMEDCVTSIRAG
jgi:hypothetical protein